MRFAGCAHLEKFPFLPAPPAIFDAQRAIDMLYVVLHGEGDIALPVKCTSNKSNCAARHKLADKNDPAPPGISRFSPHIKAQVHFLEIAMQRDRQTEKTGIEKQKSDNADERFAVFTIDLGTGGNERVNQSRIDDVIQHRQITPVGAKKWFHATVRRSHFVVTESIAGWTDTIAKGHSLRLGHRTEIGTLRGENRIRPSFVFLPWRGWNS